MLQGLKGLPELEAHLVLQGHKGLRVGYKEHRVLKERHSLDLKVHRERKELREPKDLYQTED